MSIEEVIARLFSKFPASEKSAAPVKDYATIQLRSREDLLPVLSLLKEQGFAYLDMLSAVDWKGPVLMEGYVREMNPNALQPGGAAARPAPAPAPGFAYRDEMTAVYLLSNLPDRLKVFLKVDFPRSDAVLPSAVGLFKSADWQEREAYDLFGIAFEGHPNLKKILTAQFLEGHPLRKDYAHVRDRFDA